MSHRPVAGSALALAAALSAAGCTTVSSMWTRAPVEQLAVAAASVEAARSAGAEQHANKEFINARLKLESARKLSKDGEHARARELAIEADVDAQLARSKAAAERSMLAAAEVEAGMRALREALQRGEPVTQSATPQPVAPPNLPSPASPNGSDNNASPR